MPERPKLYQLDPSSPEFRAECDRLLAEVAAFRKANNPK